MQPNVLCILVFQTNGTNTIDCSEPFQPVKSFQVELKFPNLAFDPEGHEGTVNSSRYLDFGYLE